MKKRPLFHVDGETGLRGGERQLLYLAAALRARGRRNVVYAKRGSELAGETERQGFETRFLPFLGEWDPISSWKLGLAAQKEEAVIHAHTGHAAGLAVLASAFGTPWVAHRRVDFPPGALSVRFKYARAVRTVAVSSAIAEIMRAAGTPVARLAVIPDGIPATAAECAWTGVDEDRFRPPTAGRRVELRRALADEFGLDLSAPWIGNLAALVPHKDHDTLIAAALIVLLQKPQARFLIAGRGPEESRSTASIARMGLTGKILLVGHRPDPIPLLKSLDVYVQSSWGEGMGSVLIEAAACGVPVAATSAGGIPEVVSDDETGLIVEPRRPEALAATILRLIDDRTLASRLAETARARLPRFGLARMAEDMEAVYDQLS